MAHIAESPVRAAYLADAYDHASDHLEDCLARDMDPIEVALQSFAAEFDVSLDSPLARVQAIGMLRDERARRREVAA